MIKSLRWFRRDKLIEITDEDDQIAYVQVSNISMFKRINETIFLYSNGTVKTITLKNEKEAVKAQNKLIRAIK